MSKSSTQLFFNYPSTAKIRIKIQNCFISDDFPYMYGIITKKLAFMIPKVAAILTKTHVYIPNDIYKQELNKYYSKLKSNICK
jgi:hypothetical protein